MTLRDWDDIFKKYGVPGPDQIQSVINELIAEYRDRGTSEKDYAAKIFDPRLTDMTKLPIGILDHKEEVLPLELVPESRDDLRALCERMIIRNRNHELIVFVANGWPGEGDGAAKLARHVNELWHLRSVKPELYRALVRGQHRVVVDYLWRTLPPKPFTRPQLRRMLLCQALLWCTNDIQLILARNALAERDPLGAFIVSNKRKLEPARVVNDLRGHLVLLRLLLDLYVTTAEETRHDGRKTSEVPEDPTAKLLERRIERHAASKQIDLMALRSKLDATIPYLKKMLGRAGKKFRQELEKPVTSTELSKHLHGLWFSGLSNLAASAVPLMRYVQAEAELDGVIAGLIPEKGRIIEAREPTALPAFDQSRLRRTSAGRLKELLRLYRRELLGDADFTNKVPVKGRKQKAGGTAISAARKFLEQRRDRLIGDDKGNVDSPERTFYLLDIIPEVRLHW